MRKLFVILVAIFLMATSAYAWVETADNGPQFITSCYIRTGSSADIVSGSVVVLDRSNTTYPGKAVTGSVTLGQRIYGVVVDSGISAASDQAGGFVKVQRSGYLPVIKVVSATTAGQALYTSATKFSAAAAGSDVSENTVVWDTLATANANGTTRGFIY